MSWKIQGRIYLSPNGTPIEEGFRDGHGKPADGLEAVFPIVRTSDEEPWRPIGTGFFISNNGLFATARHVLMDSPTSEPSPDLAGIQLIRRENRAVIRQIIKISSHPGADVAVGFLFDKEFVERGEQAVNKFFSLTSKTPQRGEKAVTLAFPKQLLIPSEDAFELRFTSCVYEGEIEEEYPHGRDRHMLPSHCFQTTMNLEGGASGGPVGFGDGSIFGINSTGIPGQPPVSFVSSASDLLELSLNNVRLLDGQIRSEISIAELVSLGLVIVNH
ncbi:MAG: trypsin-like peptidase domain-containing protein [Candidatus Brocadiales bacterium]|nr:trypsin-like peptidase domain-containing protein [Candidatus Bathyanammoxibius sp.]